MRFQAPFVLASLLIPACAAIRQDAGEEAYALLFASSRSGSGDLYVLPPAGGEPRLWAGTEAPEGTPRWDASRARVVYQRFPADGESGSPLLISHGAGVLPEAGSELFVDPNGDAPPCWSPDGKWIAYIAERDGRSDVFLADAQGRERRRLTDDAIVDRYPAWSPSSDRLVFARRLEAGWDLFSLAIDDPEAEPVRLTEDERYVGHPAWSPDGRFLAFDASFEGEVEIAALELATGEVRRVVSRAGNDLVPAWSPDGARLVFGGVTPADGNWDLWQVELASGALERLTEDPAFDGAPVFVPASLLVR